MIFGWKKPSTRPRPKGDWADLYRKLRFFPQDDPSNGKIKLEGVSLPPAILNLNVQIEPGAWVLLHGDDDFAKALFCDLCFNYIQPELGTVNPGMKGSDVSFLGRSNTTYGKSLIEHLSCGVRESSKELLEFVSTNVLSQRFQRHLSKKSGLEFIENKKASQVDLDERDYLEIAEANLLLQKRKAAVIDTTTDFYKLALEQGFRHSEVFLKSGKTLLWIVDDSNPIPTDACPWKESRFSQIKCSSLYFQIGSRADHIN